MDQLKYAEWVLQPELGRTHRSCNGCANVHARTVTMRQAWDWATAEPQREHWRKVDNTNGRAMAGARSDQDSFRDCTPQASLAKTPQG